MYVEFESYQWNLSNTQYDVEFVDGGDWDHLNTSETFLINGQSKVQSSFFLFLVLFFGLVFFVNQWVRVHVQQLRSIWSK